MKQDEPAYVSIIDDEGFATALVGPFDTRMEASIWADKMTEEYQNNGGQCQEPYTVLQVEDPSEYEDLNDE